MSHNNLELKQVLLFPLGELVDISAMERVFLKTPAITQTTEAYAFRFLPLTRFMESFGILDHMTTISNTTLSKKQGKKIAKEHVTKRFIEFFNDAVKRKEIRDRNFAAVVKQWEEKNPKLFSTPEGKAFIRTNIAKTVPTSKEIIETTPKEPNETPVEYVERLEFLFERRIESILRESYVRTYGQDIPLRETIDVD
jgi:hypothetical protein